MEKWVLFVNQEMESKEVQLWGEFQLLYYLPHILILKQNF